MDSWNAVILLQRKILKLLAERRISVYILDMDAEGPTLAPERWRR